MNRLRILLASVLLLLDTPLAAQQPDVPDPQILAKVLNQFGAELTQRAGPADANQCLSPASASLVLLMVLAGAGGDTAAELRTALAPPGWDDARIHAAARDLLRALREPGPHLELAVVDDLWPQQGHALRPDYLAKVRASYDATLRPLDFRGNAEAARRTINEHISKATASRIAELMPPGSVDTETRLVLTNAIYFKAQWTHGFDPEQTHDQTFTLGSGATVEVPTMHLHTELAYGESDDVQVVRLGYRGGNFAMEFALPRAGKALAAAEQALAALGQGRWGSALSPSDVVLRLPRFRIESQLLLGAALRQLGLVRVFAAGANFTAIDGGAGALRISEVIQKTFLEVGEKGTEAAAATGLVKVGAAVRPQEPKQPILFLADRAFCYRIVDARTGLVLFTGRVVDPRR